MGSVWKDTLEVIERNLTLTVALKNSIQLSDIKGQEDDINTLIAMKKCNIEARKVVNGVKRNIEVFDLGSYFFDQDEDYSFCEFIWEILMNKNKELYELVTLKELPKADINNISDEFIRRTDKEAVSIFRFMLLTLDPGNLTSIATKLVNYRNSELLYNLISYSNSTKGRRAKMLFEFLYLSSDLSEESRKWVRPMITR